MSHETSSYMSPIDRNANMPLHLPTNNWSAEDFIRSCCSPVFEAKASREKMLADVCYAPGHKSASPLPASRFYGFLGDFYSIAGFYVITFHTNAQFFIVWHKHRAIMNHKPVTKFSSLVLSYCILQTAHLWPNSNTGVV